MSSPPKDLTLSSSDSLCWIPLESDPNILTTYLQSLSLTDHYLIDVPVIDGAEEMGLFVGHNVKAFIFLYEINERSEEKPNIAKSIDDSANGLFHMQQLIKNSCGDMALIHAYLNTVEPSKFEPSSLISILYNKTANLDYVKKGSVFVAIEQIREMHKNAAILGQSRVGDLNKVDLHYVAIVPHRGTLFKLDGRCSSPSPLSVIPQGADFKATALQAIKELMQRDPDNLYFSVMAFCGN